MNRNEKITNIFNCEYNIINKIGPTSNSVQTTIARKLSQNIGFINILYSILYFSILLLLRLHFLKSKLSFIIEAHFLNNSHWWTFKITNMICKIFTEALEYHGSSFLFLLVSFVSRELVLFSSSYIWFPRVIFGFRKLFLVSASYFWFPRVSFVYRELFFISMTYFSFPRVSLQTRGNEK